MSDVKPVAWMPDAVFEDLVLKALVNACVSVVKLIPEDVPLYNKAAVDALQAEIEALRKDAERLDWVQRNLLSADFEYEYQPGKTRPVLIIAWPRDVAIGGNARMNFDAAIAKEKQPCHAFNGTRLNTTLSTLTNLTTN